ncbi:MAG: exosortase-associated EpsI family protein [Planctomycetota bacterium]
MKLSGSHLAVVAGAVLLVVGATVVQGRWSERWTPISRDAVIEAAKLLEERFPEQFGEWEFERELESDPKELEAAGAVGHISRLYRNSRSKARVSAFVVCALPYDASAHTPDRCYPGAGFSIGESEHRVKVDLGGGRAAEAFTATFVKAGQTLRIFWTYGVPGDSPAAPLEWTAPQLARIALAGEPSVYKLYAIADQTRIGASQSMVECENFIAQLVPALDASLAGGDNPTGGDPTAPGPASDPQPAATDAAAAR